VLNAVPWGDGSHSQHVPVPECAVDDTSAASWLQLCRLIPCGKVTTYGDMAKVLQSSARAVGQVCMCV
jgi:O6-methylguanine-DNA--protein-cysteine methyltransferase